MPTPGGPYSGIWKLEDISKFRQENNWPVVGAIGLVSGGYLAPARLNTIQEIKLGSTGNATDFGDLTSARNKLQSGSNKTRAVFAGGQTPSIVNTIDYITIASTGNATDYGDLINASARLGGDSNGHGGLS